MTQLPIIRVSARELQSISDRITVLRDWYNGHQNVVPCRFDGDPSDLSTLTFISYELGVDLWEWDLGETLCFSWGNVLVKRFSFEWGRLAGDSSPRLLALHNATLPYTIFPWPRLYELIDCRKRPDTAAEDLLVTFLSELYFQNAIPSGWHPALDALERRSYDIPENIIGQLQKLSACEPNWLRRLGLFPYKWNNEVSWETVSSCLSAMISNSGPHHRC